MSNTIYVGNLSYRMSEGELASAFSSFGNVSEAKIIQDRMTGRSRGFGFVSFDSDEEAQKALEMNGKEVGGRSVFVSIAREKSQGGGGGGGRRFEQDRY
jgi:RNA recognition motif-containing protein